MSFNYTSRKGALPFAVVPAFLILMSPAVMAAQNGDAKRASDGGSEGSVGISMNVPQLIRITGLTDVTISEDDVMTAINTPASYEKLIDACVGGNGSFQYDITITSGTGAYELVADDGSGNLAVPFSVEWKSTPADYNTAVPNQALDQTHVGNTCDGNPQNLKITVADTALADAGNGAYVSTLTLTVKPQ